MDRRIGWWVDLRLIKRPETDYFKSLARAVYSRKPVLLLDDILSGLDRRTEHAIFTRLFGRDGIFRGSDTTVVLVTHSSEYSS